MSGEVLRAVVIGARRVRQGIGHHLARFLHAAGVEICTVCGTTDGSAAQAADDLAPVLGHRPEPATDVSVAIKSAQPDIVVIASPDATHETYLELALASEAHVLCEKPVIWGGPDPEARALALGRAFVAAGRHLAINAQWPLTLPTYRTLWPEVDPGRARTFWMRMSPMSGGAGMIPAAMPHPLALLAHALPQGPSEIDGIQIERVGGSTDDLRITFGYLHAGGRLDCTIEITSVPEQPRPAGYGFDGHRADRGVDLRSYAMHMEAEDRVVPLPDPTPPLVRSFVERIRAGAEPEVDLSLDPGMGHLLAIQAAWDLDLPDTPSAARDT